MKKSIVVAMIIALLACGAPLLISTQVTAASALSDIANHWAKAQIEHAVVSGYVSGYPDGTFRPDEKVTRVQFIRMLVDALKLPSSQGGTPWYQAYVAAALDIGILEQSDFSDYKALITRLEIMRLLSRGIATDSQYEAYLDAYSGLYSGDIPYVDYRDIPDADVPHVAMVIGAGIVSGYPDFSLGLTKTAKRSEAVVMIENLLATMLKAPDANRGLLELKEVAETGTNATTVSKLEPQFNFVTEPVIEETSKYDAKLKRSYVLPSKGELSLFDRLLLWDRKEVDPVQFDEHVGFVFNVFEVSVKKDFSFNAVEFHTKVFPTIIPTDKNGSWFFTAQKQFNYLHSRIKPQVLINFEAGETYDVVLFSLYKNPIGEGKSTAVRIQSEETNENTDIFYHFYFEQ